MPKKTNVTTVHENLAGLRDDVKAFNEAIAAARPVLQEATALMAAIAAIHERDDTAQAVN